MTYRFEWDQWKARRNRAKHGVSFEEGSTVFSDQWMIFIEDLEHSESEDRFLGIGMSSANRLLLVAFTLTPEVDYMMVRLISCRRATHPERLRYERS